MSIIVPVFNAETYLAETLESALRQTLSDIEVLCVNDGSTDSSERILQQYAQVDSRIRVVSKANSGYGDSVNRGIEESKGEYVTVLEADDFIVPRACEILTALAKEHNLDFAKADGKQFFGDGDKRVFRKHVICGNEAAYESVFNPSAEPRAFHSNPGQPALYRRSFLQGNGIRLNTTPGAAYQDTGLWAQGLFCAQRARFSHEAVYMIRRDNEASSVFDMGKAFAICGEYDFIRSRIDELPVPSPVVAAAACAYFRFDGYLWNLRRISPDLCPEFLNRFSQDFLRIERAGELDWGLFSADEAALLKRIMKNGSEFAQEWYCMRIEELQKQVQDKEQRYLRYVKKVQGSLSWKIGRAVTKAPRAMRARKADEQ